MPLAGKSRAVRYYSVANWLLAVLGYDGISPLNLLPAEGLSGEGGRSVPALNACLLGVEMEH